MHRRSRILLALACAIGAICSSSAPARAASDTRTGTLAGNVALTLRLFGYTTFSVRVDCLKAGADAEALIGARFKTLKQESQHDRFHNDTQPYFTVPVGSVETSSNADGSFACAGLSPGYWFAYVEVDHRYRHAAEYVSAEGYGRIAGGITTQTAFVRDFYDIDTGDMEPSQIPTYYNGDKRRPVAPLPTPDEATIEPGPISFNIHAGVRMKHFNDRILAPKVCILLRFNAYNWAFVTQDSIESLPMDGYPSEYLKNVHAVYTTPQQICNFGGLAPGVYIALVSAVTSWSSLENSSVTRTIPGGIVPGMDGPAFVPDRSIDVPTLQKQLHFELHRRASIVTILSPSSLLSTDMLDLYDFDDEGYDQVLSHLR